MDELRNQLGFSDLSDQWCSDIIKDDFCSYCWPASWTYQESLIGLEEPFKNFLAFLDKKQDRIWDSLVLSDVIRLQCITNIVLESCIKSEGSPFTGLLCSSGYVKLSAAAGSSARNVFHNMIFGKVLELMKTQDDPECFSGLLTLHQSLSELLISDCNITDQSYWLLVKSSLASINLNCSLKEANNQSFNNLFSSMLSQPEQFKFFIKEAFPYIKSGNSYLSKRCSLKICQFVENNINNQNILSHHLNLVENLCFSISERTEPRKQNEVFVLELIGILPQDYFTQLVDWIINDFSVSQKVVHRIFAIQLCFKLSKVDANNFCTKFYDTIISALCDKAPTVRAKSAMVISDLLDSDEINVLSHFSPYFDANNPKNILTTVILLSSDEKSCVRKATCFLWLTILLKIGLKSVWLKILYHLCLDTAVSVKKQALAGICQLLSNYQNNPKIQRLWLETVLLATNDDENSVKDYSGLQLQNLLDSLHESESSWEILQLIAHPKSIDLQKLFDHGIINLPCYKISATSKKYLMDKLSDDKGTKTALFAISKFMNHFEEIDIQKLLEIFDKCLHVRSDENYQTMCIVLNCVRKQKELNNIETLVDKFYKEVNKFSHPYLLIKEFILTIANLLHRSSKDDLILLCEESTVKIGTVLQNLCLNHTLNSVISSKKLCCYLFTLGELSMHFTKYIDKNTILSIKELIINNNKNEFSVSVRAHAIISLGKLCLVYEDIAKDTVMLFSKVLEDDKHFEIRNNILIVLGDLIVRYPTIIADYMYCVTDCLQDDSTVLRRQAIIIITKLLQEDYIKWRSGTVMKFITNLVSDDVEIRQLCQLCLTNILLIRYPKTYFDFFVEVVFFANGLLSFLTTPDPNLLQFSLQGTENESKRENIYCAMLQNLNDQQKLDVTSRICNEILSLFISDDDEPIDKNLVPLLQDSLWILSCDSLRLSLLKKRACHDFDDDDIKIEMIAAQTKVISTIVKRNFVENCTPIIIQLRNKLKRLKSPLQQNFTKFVVSFIRDYKDEIEVLSGADAEFIAEVQYDVKKLEKQENNPEAVTLMQKSVTRILTTPGFLKMASTGIALNSSIAHGPGSFFLSPFFTAPTPYTSSKSVLYTKPTKPSNAIQHQLRKNLLDNFPGSATVVQIVNKESTISNDLTKGYAIIKDSSNMKCDFPEHVTETTSIPNLTDQENVQVKITSSPVAVSTRNKDKILPMTIVGVKQETASPICDKKLSKPTRNLLNPETCTSLQNISTLSLNDTHKESRHEVLILNKAGSGCLKVINKIKSTKVLFGPDSPKDCTKEEPGFSQETQPIPFLGLGQLIKQKLHEQRQKVVECEENAENKKYNRINDDKRESARFNQLMKQFQPIKDVGASYNKEIQTVNSDLEERQNDTDVIDPLKSSRLVQLPAASAENLANEPVCSNTKPLVLSQLPENLENDPQDNIKVPFSKNFKQFQVISKKNVPTINENKHVLKKPVASATTKSSIKASKWLEQLEPKTRKEKPNKTDIIECQNPNNVSAASNVSKGDEICSIQTSEEKVNNYSGIQSNDAVSKSHDKSKSARLKKLMQKFKPSKDFGASNDVKIQTISDQERRKVADVNEPVKTCKVLQEPDPFAENLTHAPVCTEPVIPSQLPSLENVVNSPVEKSPVQKQCNIENRTVPISNILKQFQVASKENIPTSDKNEHVFKKPVATATTKSKERVSKLMEQFKPITAATRKDRIIDKPENILLTNQVVRKRKNLNESGHFILQEDDMIPKSKRMSYDNIVNLSSNYVSRNIIASTPIEAKLSSQLDCDISPIKSCDTNDSKT